MSVAIGLGLMDYPFAGAGDYWRWVDLRGAGGKGGVRSRDRDDLAAVFNVALEPPHAELGA